MEKPNISEKIELSEREYIRLLFLNAGFLVTDIEIPDLPEDLPEGITLPIQLPPNTPTMAEWLDEERGEY